MKIIAALCELTGLSLRAKRSNLKLRHGDCFGTKNVPRNDIISKLPEFPKSHHSKTFVRHAIPTTQNQAFSASLSLCRHVLQQELHGTINAMRAKKEARLPVVMSKDEVRRLIAHLLYGSGLRLMKGVHLRVKDIDFAQHQILARDGNAGRGVSLCYPIASSLALIAQNRG